MAGSRIATQAGSHIATQAGNRIATQAGSRIAAQAGSRIATQDGSRITTQAGSRVIRLEYGSRIFFLVHLGGRILVPLGGRISLHLGGRISVPLGGRIGKCPCPGPGEKICIASRAHGKTQDFLSKTFFSSKKRPRCVCVFPPGAGTKKLSFGCPGTQSGRRFLPPGGGRRHKQFKGEFASNARFLSEFELVGNRL
jgi:hypothetical protein